MSLEIKHGGKTLSLMKSVTRPDFSSKTVLTDSVWEYAKLYLRQLPRSIGKESLFYWEQANNFFNASVQLPTLTKPLTSYYCLLNATKAFLVSQGVGETRLKLHGVGGSGSVKYASLANEKVNFKSSGVLPALCSQMGESSTKITYNLKDILYNLPYTHRAFCMTYKTNLDKELFIPILHPMFVRKKGSSEAWFQFELESKYADQHTLNKLPSDFVRDSGMTDRFVIRMKKRFRWDPQAKQSERIAKLSAYHRQVRRHTFYILGHQRLWYIKRAKTPGCIDRSSLVLTFVAMHRLSEMSRYQPHLMDSHLNGHHGWLLTEFINKALFQFIDEISSEMTGKDVLPTGFRT